MTTFDGGDTISRKKTLLVLIGAVAVLFAASVAYSMLSDNDPTRHHTGLGEAIDISPDDEQLAFSYFDQGRESLHVGNLEDGSTTQLTSPEAENHSHPTFTPDGEGLFYIATVEDRIQTLRYLPERGADPVELTDSDMHVFEAVMSPDGETFYYIGMPAEDLLAREGEKENFRDLYRVGADGTKHEQLTDKDALDMNSLNISEDGSTLHFIDGMRGAALRTYDIETGEEKPFEGDPLPGEVFNVKLSPDGNLAAYTTMVNEEEGGTYIYELFLMDMGSGDTQQVTDYGASVTSPAFFYDEDRIAFLAQPNWPGAPASYELMTVDHDGEEMGPLAMDLPESEGGFQLGAVLDRMVNTATLTILYLLLFGLSIAYGNFYDKAYMPVIISAVLALIAFISSFIATSSDPWAGVFLFVLSIWLLGCSVALLIFAFIYKRMVSDYNYDEKHRGSP
ncbi:SMP-30/gluconolactonase/LRE family protein [Salinicoccus roseus]|uniref:SMP-30/gluconolactonase/LRE family protein n=1 Tax=Salinicoccus roseus TaxID=45670 RepID=UPI00230151EC|nr:SMP-30/gluconolactonase/LRE family protein [Salinicoccus roseus]